MRAIETADQLTEPGNEYMSRAVPFAMVLTSGVADGYMELADYFAAGAKSNKMRALEFQRKASDYRALANHIVLRFAENVKKMDRITGDSVQLAFGPPKGSAVDTPMLNQIARGIMPSPQDEEAVVAIVLDHGVLKAVCNAAGAPNNVAKASELLQKSEFLVRRSKYMQATADQLEKGSQLYARNKLDDSSKLSMLHQMSQDALRDAAAGNHTAMVLQVNGKQ